MIQGMVLLNNGTQVPLQLEFMTFSGGECHVKIKNVEEISELIHTVSLYAYIQSAESFISTLLLADAIKRLPEFLPGSSRMILEMPYIPAARQDRPCEAGEALSADVYAKMLNTAGFNKIIVEDPHSDVAPSLINNVTVVEQYQIVQNLLENWLIAENVALVSPDAGSQKKILKLARALGGVDVIKADKVRDTTDGKITDTKVYNDVTGRKVLIVDDILDGGGTFIPLAQKLREKGAVQVDLFVTHGIFSKGVDIFDGYLDNIYTQNTWASNVEGRNTKGILKNA